MASKPEFLGCIEERKQESFFKVLNSVDISSENMRAIPHDFARNFSNNELLGNMKIRAYWGSSWEVKISKIPRFYFMEKSGWEKFVRDNALGRNEFLIFTHKGRMHFSVNIMNQFGKEMLLPPQSRAFLASSSRLQTEQDVKAEEVVVSSELSSRGPRTAAESNGAGMYKRKFNFGKKKAEESQYSKKTERVVSIQSDYAGTSSSSISGFNIFISKSYLNYLWIPTAANDYMPRVKTMLKIHHPDGKKSWDVVFVVTRRVSGFSGGWRRLCKEYPIVLGDTCKFTFIKPHELLLLVSKTEVAGASPSSLSGFNIFISKSYLNYLWIPTAVNDYMPRVKTVLKIHHPDGKKSWDVVFVGTRMGPVFSGGWRRLCKEYPIVLGDTCEFTFTKPHELLLLVSKP